MIKAFESIEEWIVELAAMAKDYEILHNETAGNEEDWQKGQMDRERLMDELDGTNMAEEEFEEVVALQLPTNPYRLRLHEANKRLWEAC
tara:strand:+ start:81 stop:347 length:267 start_codon:yes stop_codon:yes gene_type:complete